MVQKVFIHKGNKTLRVRPNTENPGAGETLLGTIDHDSVSVNDAVGFKVSHVLFQDVENLCMRRNPANGQPLLVDYVNYKILVIKPVTGINAGNDITVTAAAGANHTKQLTPAVLPEDTTESKTVTYVSSAPDKATVSNAGLVTGVAAGTTVITVTTAGGLTDTVTVTVT